MRSRSSFYRQRLGVAVDFLIGILLGLMRLIFIGSLALGQWFRSRRRERIHAGSDYAPFVSIIVPAYNEELVIENTIRSLLASDYSAYEILVIDDGSHDNTSKVVGRNSRMKSV